MNLRLSQEFSQLLNGIKYSMLYETRIIFFTSAVEQDAFIIVH